MIFIKKRVVLDDATLFFCLARLLQYIRRKALQPKYNKNNLIIKEKKHDNFS